MRLSDSTLIPQPGIQRGFIGCLPYEDDKLPIPDLSEGQFSRSDALALASFYKIALPNIEYEFVTNIVHFSSDSANLFNRINEEYSHIVP
ncbi:unnamed protein product [Rotaria socialis]|uniref:Uncharacterized protein n=1 Tax=Rotaria socialis TaxID=392032 RepID=A0A819B2F9_9BILA|nr:unnamed protein product [Rotaria socialis]